MTNMPPNVPTRLSVNLNKVALLRNQRDHGIPSVTHAATVCINAGAAGITVHPRPDQRHITTQDVYDLADLLKAHQHIEYNIEGNPFEGAFMDLIQQVKPHQATLVPDSPGQRTSDHGWDVLGEDRKRLGPVIDQLKNRGIRVSLFMDPNNAQIAGVKKLHAHRVELYTQSFATAFRQGQQRVDAVLPSYVEAAKTAQDDGLGINAGHDLNLKNLGYFCKHVPGVLEVSIGHELIADSLWVGMAASIKAYLAAMGSSIT